ncbi:hypothetical protein M758_4G182300 [Ceratodon purpureus]|nr:hypothetical protein M758_4G182300 [Ceratodon purpureus]
MNKPSGMLPHPRSRKWQCAFSDAVCDTLSRSLNVMACNVRANHGNQEAQISIILAPCEIPTGGALWSKIARFLLAMQNDCDIVLYDLEKNRLPLWMSNPSGHATDLRENADETRCHASASNCI